MTQRVVYVLGHQAAKEAGAEHLGCQIVDVQDLPRNTPEENRFAIQAWLRGMAEGTIKADAETRKELELSARLDGLLVAKSARLNIHATLDEATLEALLDLRPSRHTRRILEPDKPGED